MSAISVILPRLEAGRPLILGGDPEAELLARGVVLPAPAALGRLLREQPMTVADHYELEIASGVDVLCALTSETTPRALGQIGMAFRAAALTGAAVDLAHDAAQRAARVVAVAGLLGARSGAPLQPDRIAEEYAMHAARLAAAGCEILIARGCGGDGPYARLARLAAVVSGSSTQLPTWAVIEVGAGLATPDGEPVGEWARAAVDSGATLLLLEAPSPEVALVAMERAGHHGEPRIGVLLAASHGHAASPDAAGPEAWAAGAKRLVDAGARVIGGGLGTTAHHVTALGRLLGRADRTSIWPRAV